MSRLRVHPPLRGAAGTVVAAVLGALSSALIVGLWALAATVFGGRDVSFPLGWALLEGACVGIVLALWRGERDTGWAAVVFTGLGAGAVWIALSRGRPLRDPLRTPRGAWPPPS